MGEVLRNRRLGWASVALSLLSTALFYGAYTLARNSPAHLSAALTAGKSAILLGLIAATVGGMGIVLDRYKILAMTGVFAGVLLAGFFGMFVYNI